MTIIIFYTVSATDLNTLHDMLSYLLDQLTTRMLHADFGVPLLCVCFQVQVLWRTQHKVVIKHFRLMVVFQGQTCFIHQFCAVLFDPSSA